VFDTQDFYDIVFFNTDTFDVTTTYNKIAEMNFWLHPDEVSHVRIVYSLFDWLGSIGGVYFLLITLVAFIAGGYLYFNMIIEIMIPLFSYSKEEEERNIRR